MAQYASAVNSFTRAFCCALVDSLSFHRAAKFVVNSESVRQEVGLTLMANGFLLVGSVFLYQYFIEPVSHLMTSSLSDSSSVDSSSTLTSISVWSFYHLMWMIPIWGLCYAVSLGCYQSIADDVFRIEEEEAKKRDKSSIKKPATVDVKRSISGTVYAGFVWAFMFLQMRAFDRIIPFLLQYVAHLLLGVSQVMQLPPALESIVTVVFVHPISVACFLFRAFGLFFGGVVYGWYGFDMVWIAGGLQPDTRFQRVEENWAYFCGFGMPYVFLLKSTSFFMGYGVYLMVFPFTIMLGAVSDFDNHRLSEHKKLRVFNLARQFSLKAIKAIDKYLRPSKMKRKMK